MKHIDHEYYCEHRTARRDGIETGERETELHFSEIENIGDKIAPAK